MVSEQEVWKILDGIPDPEIPVISVVELGVVREIELIDEKIIISITPTYSGCPAMHQMKDDIKNELKKNGLNHYELKTVLSPAWTTDWMSEKTKEKLNNYGIAPPKNEIKCPQCNSENVEIISEFGSTACKSLYKCLSCLEPFDFFKCI